MHLKTLGRKMGGLCIIIIKVYSRGTLQRLKRKGKIVLALFVTFILPIFDFVFANKVDLLFFLYLSNWKAPLIKLCLLNFCCCFYFHKINFFRTLYIPVLQIF